MGRVDPDDDSILRFVLRHYRFDPERHERRHVVVAAFDNQDEFLAAVESLGAEVRSQKERGVGDQRESVSGVVLEPGAGARQRAERAAAWSLTARMRSRRDSDG
jgi:hypothetical protein